MGIASHVRLLMLGTHTMLLSCDGTDRHLKQGYMRLRLIADISDL
jgi:hypothetical protein